MVNITGGTILKYCHHFSMPRIVFHKKKPKQVDVNYVFKVKKLGKLFFSSNLVILGTHH